MKVTNGKDVARLLVDEYLNCHPTGHKKFMESMAKEQQEIKDNYTYLGFAWLKGLSEVGYYDLRNEASKLMADDLCLRHSQKLLHNGVGAQHLSLGIQAESACVTAV